MLALDRSHDAVYLVTAPIPLIGAQPGDELVIRPTNATYPVTLLRRPAPELAAAIPHGSVRLLAAAAIPHGSVRLLAAYERDSDVLVDQETDEARQPTLQLVR